MPKIPSDDGLRDRMEKLETKIDNHAAESRERERSLGGLESKIDNHTKKIEALDKHFADLRTLIEDRTSASRTVTWAQLGALLIVLLIPIGGAVAAVFNSYVFPQRVETVVSGSESLNSRYGTIVEEKLKTSESIKSIGTELKTNNDEIKAVREDLQLFIKVVGPSLSRQSVMSLLQKQTSGHRSSLGEKLPFARDLLTAVAKMSVQLTRQDYRDLSQRLFANYSVASESLRKELWATLVAAADARSVTETKTHELPESAIAQAKEAGTYVEGRTIDLSSESTWNNTIFKDCKIVISKSENPIALEGVRFIDCIFEPVEDEIHRQLVAAFLENTRSTVNATVDNINVTMIFSPGTPKPQPSSGESTR